MSTMKTFLILLVLLFGAPCAALAQIAGYSGADADADGLPDDFEQAILQKFQPVWKFNAQDCDVLPAEFEPFLLTPTVRDRNGTIYGQVFFRGSNSAGYFVEAHFYDLWGADCGFFNSHPLDAEHVSALIQVLDSSQPLSEWQATHWYFAAHEDTPCDSSKTVSASSLNAEDNGATVWVSWGKHAAYSERRTCNNRGGCGQDRCDDPILTHTTAPVNLGESNAPLNGALWASSDQWPLLQKMDTDFSDKLLSSPGRKPPGR